MRLWTWHTPGFSLTDGRVMPERSDYFRTVEGVPAAYRELARLLGTDQLIWCYTQPGLYAKTSIEKVGWQIDVPDEDILAFVDEVVWNRILGVNRFVPPRDLRYQWRDESIRLHPTDMAARDAYENEQHAAYWAMKPPDGGWWSCLRLEPQQGEHVSALVRHPLPTSAVTQIVEKPRPQRRRIR